MNEVNRMHQQEVETSVIKAVKLTSIAGEDGRRKEKNKMLTSIYGVTFQKKSLLDDDHAM